LAAPARRSSQPQTSQGQLGSALTSFQTAQQSQADVQRTLSDRTAELRAELETTEASIVRAPLERLLCHAVF
jgi:hypothetical protein